MSITPRERQVLHLIAHEYTTPEIAELLFISRHTVISHRKMLMRKFNAKNTAGLIRRSYEEGVLKIQTDEPVILKQFAQSA